MHYITIKKRIEVFKLRAIEFTQAEELADLVRRNAPVTADRQIQACTTGKQLYLPGRYYKPVAEYVRA
jgi:hypothetical protein